MTRTDGELFALLRPWHAALRAGCVGAAHDTSPVPSPLFSSDGSAPEGARVLWVSGKGDDVGLLAEALDLLALVARARASAVHYAVAQLWPHRLINWFDEDHEAIAPPPFVLGLSVRVRSREDLAPLADWLTGLHDYSNDYVHVRELLDIDSSESVDGAPVPVGLRSERRGESREDGKCFDEMLHSLVPLAMLQQRPRGESALMSTVATSSAARFEIRQFDYGYIEMAFTLKSVCYMGQLAEWGVTFDHLPAVRDNANAHCSAKVTRALHRLLAVSGQTSPVARGVTTLTVLDDTPWEITHAVLSAAQASTTLRHLRVKTTGRAFGADIATQRSRLWRWIAYTTISRHANSLIKILDPDVDDLTLREVALMERIKAAQDPLREVLYPQGSGTPLPLWVASRRFYLADPKLEIYPVGPNMTLTLDTAVQVRTVKTLEAGNTWWAVLLPGRGLAWVNADDASKEVAEPPSIDVTATAATEIILGGVTGRYLPAVSALLKLVGATLRSIDVDAFNTDHFIDDWCHTTCTHCPQLDRIRFLDISLRSAQTVVDMYDTGKCRASRLHLDGFVSDHSPRHIQRLLEVLQDPHHAMTQHVEDLSLWIRIEERDDQDILDGLHRMLEQNRRLHSVCVEICVVQPSFPTLDYEAVQLSFAKYNAEQRAIRVGPLHIRRKIALLSVVQFQTDMSEGVMPALDSSVLAIIFQFAAQRRVRQVDVQLARSE